MLNHPVERIRIPHFLDVATYVSMVAMSLLGISGLPTLRLQILALGLALLFGCLYHFVFRSGRYEQNPSLYFGAQVLVLGLLFLLGSNKSDAFNFLFLILSVHIAVVSTARVAALWIALCFGIVNLITLTTHGTASLYAVVFYGVTFVVCGFSGHTIRQAERARDRNQRLVEELQATQRKLQEFAVLEERNRLARELHDSVKQQVFAISMQLGAAQALLDKGHQASGPVEEAERLAKQVSAELTTLIRELRPPSLESKTLAGALQDYVIEWSRQNGIVADLKVEASPMALPEAETLFRVAQEALANVARHSKASKVNAELADQNDHIILTIEDNGLGFDPGEVEKGVGLDSMRERLEAIGGQLSISSERSRGTRVIASVRRP